MIVNGISRDEVIESNIGLVHACARKFIGKGVEYDDLFQAGCVGLIKAVDGFDPTKGYKFSTYAVPVILGEIKRIFRDDGTVSVSRSIKEKARKIIYEREKFNKNHNREPTVKELAKILELDEFEIAQAITASMPVISLTQSDENDAENQFDLPVESAENEISDSIALRQVINKLDENDRQIIQLRYFKGLTQTVTAKRLGMSQVQISRKEKKILNYMRSKLL